MLNSILPPYICNLISKYDYEKLQEIHLRVNSPIVVEYDHKKNVLNDDCCNIKITQEVLSKIIFKCSDFSIYSVQNQLQQGYLCLKNGIRIGIGGEFSFDNYNLKKIQCLTIRIPHKISTNSNKLLSKITENGEILSTLIIGPPGAGKTTLLRDVVNTICNNMIINISIIDDRNEISALSDGKPTFLDGKYLDIISFKTKYDGIMHAVKNLNPDLIITDEITLENDISAIEKCLSMGVNIIATIHSQNISDLQSKTSFLPLLDKKYFKRFVTLSKKNYFGEIVSVTNENFVSL